MTQPVERGVKSIDKYDTFLILNVGRRDSCLHGVGVLAATSNVAEDNGYDALKPRHKDRCRKRDTAQQKLVQEHQNDGNEPI